MIRTVIKKCLGFTGVFLFFLIIFGLVKQFILTDEQDQDKDKKLEITAIKPEIIQNETDEIAQKNSAEIAQNEVQEGERNSVHRAPGRTPGNPANPSRVAPIVTGTPSIPSASPPIVPSAALETVPSNAPELVVPQPPPGSTSQTVTSPQTQPIQKPSDQPEKNSQVYQESRSPDNTVTGTEVPGVQPKSVTIVQPVPAEQPAPSPNPQFEAPSNEPRDANTDGNTSTDRTSNTNTAQEPGKKQDWLRGYGGG